LILWKINTGEILQRFERTSSAITAIDVATNKLIAVSAHQDGSLMLWSLYKSQPIKRFEHQGASITTVAISPDASWILFTSSAMRDLFLRQIDGVDGTLLNQQTFGCIPGHLALSPDVSYVLVTCQAVIFQVYIQDWNLQRSFSESSDVINAISISQDGRLGFSASKDGNLRVWNLSGQLDHHIENINADHLTAIAISPDGKYLLMNDTNKLGYERPALWDILQRKAVFTYTGFYTAITVGAVTISPDNHFVAITGYLEDIDNSTVITPTVMVWDQKRSSYLCRFNVFTAPGRAVAFSPDSQYLLAGSQDPINRTGQLILWDVQTCKQVRQFDTSEDVTSIAFNADGTHAITGTGFFGRVTLWDVVTGEVIKYFSYTDYGPVLGVAFGPGYRTVLGSGLADLYLWDVQTGNFIRRYSGLSTSPWSVVISSDGKYILSCTMEGDVILWDFSTGEELHRLNTHLGIFSVMFSPDGKTAYAASKDGKLVEWHIAEKSLPELLDWINSNRYVRDLTCEERQQYHVDPLCKP
jgi:WD40 repeat protein